MIKQQNLSSMINTNQRQHVSGKKNFKKPSKTSTRYSNMMYILSECVCETD